jgi:hypothetical protein
MNKRWIAALAVATAAVLAGATGAAYAAGVSQSGLGSSNQIFTGDNAPWTINTVATWSDVPSTVVTVTVPTGTTKLVDARFTAESLCDGLSTAWCSVRIIITGPTGVVTELSPVTSTDYKFDTPGGLEEAHAVQRFSPPIGPGTYTVRAQALRMNGITTLTLDDYVLAVNVVNR